MIALWVGNDLSPSDIASVEAHVIDCAECQEQVEKLMSSSDVLSSLNVDLKRNPNDSVWPGLQRQLPARRIEKARTRGRVHSVLLAASFLVASVALAVLPDHFATPVPKFPAGATAQSVSSPTYEVPDEGFVRYYYDPSWQTLERLDGASTGISLNSVIGRNVGY